MTIRNVGKQNEQGALSNGWVIQTDQGYYTGNGRSQIERWTAFPKWAKVYTRKGWAQKIVEQVGGQVVPVEEPAYSSGSDQQSGRQAQDGSAS
jgi:hypothetical protein